MTQGLVARIAPLTDDLSTFCRGHVEGDGGLSATRMLAQVRASWPDVTELEIDNDPGAEQDLEVIVLRIVRDVGTIADRLLRYDAQEALGWSRANLIFDLECYLETLRRR